VDLQDRVAISVGYHVFMTTSERDAVIRARLARVPEMTAAERERQRESFAFGNVKVDEPDITRNPSLLSRLGV